MQVAVGRLQLSVTVARPITADDQCALPEDGDDLSTAAPSRDIEQILLQRERARWADANHLRTLWRS